MSVEHDVIVVGAGPGGSATAHFLARQGLDVLLLDRSEFPREKTCGDGLTPRALAMLEEMRLLDAVLRVGHRINGIAIHAPAGHSIRMPVPHRRGYPDFLLIAPRLDLDDLIRQRALASGAAFHDRVHVKGLAREDRSVTIHGERGGAEYRARARMAVLAPGANLKLLRDLGILTGSPEIVLAARAYFDGVAGLDDHVQARFDHVPLPGYGWIFPLSERSANIGVGYWRNGWTARWKPTSARAVFDRFIQSPALRPFLDQAEQHGPVRGFPIRVDFPSSPTFGAGALLVGEAAGLVSPLTGEGIDFALENGKLAAEHLLAMFERGDFSRARYEEYDRLLRRRFQRLFKFLNRIRTFYINPLLLNRYVRVSARRAELRTLLVNVLLGFQDAADGVSLAVVRKVLLGR